MLAHRLRLWPSIKTTLDPRLVLAGFASVSLQSDITSYAVLIGLVLTDVNLQIGGASSDSLLIFLIVKEVRVLI